MSCDANHVKSEESGSLNGPNVQETQPPLWSKGGLLVFRTPQVLGNEHGASLQRMLEPLAESMGMKAVITDGGSDVAISPDLSPLWQLLAAQVKAINRLAESNEALVRAMAEADGDEPVTKLAGAYLEQR